eukprot:5009633-Alexandrium_andersonii.AAC.1
MAEQLQKREVQGRRHRQSWGPRHQGRAQRAAEGYEAIYSRADAVRARPCFNLPHRPAQPVGPLCASCAAP